MANQNNVQFSLEEKIKVLNKLGQFEKFFEILFPGKYLTDEADVNEMITAILNNPVFHVEKKLLEKQAEVFINFGEFKKAVHCYDLLQEYQKISGLLIAIQEKKAVQQFTSKFLSQNETRIWNYNLKAALLIQAEMVGELMRLREQLRSGTYVEKCEFKIATHKSYGTTINFEVGDLQLIKALRNLAGQEMGAEEQNLYNKVRQRYKIDEHSMEPIAKLSTSFGESAYGFSYAIRPSADDEEKLKSRFSDIFCMTPYHFLGYNCLEADETKKKMDDFGGGMEGYDDNGGEELGAVIIYWRCDEGKGTALENILGNNLNGALEFRGGDASDEIWVPLEDGDPIELEDKWGKKCPPQFAISFKNDYNSVKCPKKNWYPGSLSKFTIELWLRPKSENGLILEVGQGNFVLTFSNSELALQMKNSTIPLKQEKNENAQSGDMDDDGSVVDRDADEEANKIKSNFWNHISVVYDNSQQKKLLVYLNCILVGSSEANLPNDLFRDQILTLGKEKLHAELTEFRFWTSALSLSEIKEQYRMPLEIVYEKKKEIKVRFKAVNKNGPGIGLPQPGIGLPQPGIGLPQPGMGLSVTYFELIKNNPSFSFQNLVVVLVYRLLVRVALVCHLPVQVVLDYQILINLLSSQCFLLQEISRASPLIKKKEAQKKDRVLSTVIQQQKNQISLLPNMKKITVKNKILQALQPLILRVKLLKIKISAISTNSLLMVVRKSNKRKLLQHQTLLLLQISILQQQQQKYQHQDLILSIQDGNRPTLQLNLKQHKLILDFLLSISLLKMPNQRKKKALVILEALTHSKTTGNQMLNQTIASLNSTPLIRNQLRVLHLELVRRIDLQWSNQLVIIIMI